MDSVLERIREKFDFGTRVVVSSGGKKFSRG